MTGPFTICWVETDDSGGLAHFSFQACEALAQAGNDVTMIAPAGNELAGLPRSFTMRDELHLWPVVDQANAGRSTGAGGLATKLRQALRRLPRAWRLVAAWRQITQSVLAEQPDCVVVPPLPFAFLSLFVARLARGGQVVVQMCHEFERRDVRNRFTARLSRRLGTKAYKYLSGVFVLSETTRVDLVDFGVPARMIHVIPHGNEDILFRTSANPDLVRERYELSATERIVLFFGRIRPTKGVDDLIRAFTLAQEQRHSNRDSDGHRGHLLVVGSPTKAVSTQSLTELARSGASSQITLDFRYVPLEEVPSLVTAAEIIVLPYRSATQSGILHAAFTGGRAVIATSVGGLAEDIEDGVSGLLVAPGDIDALARSIVRLLDDPHLAERLGAKGATLARTKHSWANVASAMSAGFANALHPDSS